MKWEPNLAGGGLSLQWGRRSLLAEGELPLPHGALCLHPAGRQAMAGLQQPHASGSVAPMRASLTLPSPGTSGLHK